MAVHHLNWNEPAPEECRGAVVTVGNFDGVHEGHASLLARLCARATDLQAPAAVMTFDPHPLLLLRPERFQPTLTTLEERARLLHSKGVDHVVILQTRPEFLQLSAADFFHRVIRQNLQARGLVEGPNFRFGHNRKGNVETLAALCSKTGNVLEIVQPLEMDGGIVSSNRIRQALQAGDVGNANRWLGRPYRLTGVVEVGQRRGQQLGFPTANLSKISTLVPGDGVYAVVVEFTAFSPSVKREGTKRWPGAANVGPNPTFYEADRKVEVHVIGFHGDLYGQVLDIDFVAKIRDTRRFDSVDQLKKQIQADVALAKELAERNEERRMKTSSF